jgi:hypothetical protein
LGQGKGNDVLCRSRRGGGGRPSSEWKLETDTEEKKLLRRGKYVSFITALVGARGQKRKRSVPITAYGIWQMHHLRDNEPDPRGDLSSNHVYFGRDDVG